MSIRKLQLGALLVLLCVAGVFTAAAQQTKTPKPPATPKPETEKPEWKMEYPTGIPKPMPSRATNPWEKTQTSEKSIEVASNVNIKLCVANQSNTGELKINGWERNEVRIFVRNGRLPGFKVLEKDEKSGKANWIYITNVRPEGSRPGPQPECLAGADIEMDVPMGSALDLYAVRSADTVVDSVRKVKIESNEGDVQIRNIAGGINATTYNGNLNVESSEGQIMLATTSGNILAFGVNQGQVGDLFKAKSSSGNVILQQVEHRQIEASSISGTINFKGKLLAGGLYSFKTSNGPIRLQLPLKSSFNLKAAYGFGGFDSELPLKIIYDNKTQGGANMQALAGSGDSSVNLTTSQGSIFLKKQL